MDPVVIFLGPIAGAFGAALDPFLSLPAAILGWRLRTWPGVIAAGVAVAFTIEALLAATGTMLGPYPFGRMLLPKMIAGVAIAAASHAIARRRRITPPS